VRTLPLDQRHRHLLGTGDRAPCQLGDLGQNPRQIGLAELDLAEFGDRHIGINGLLCHDFKVLVPGARTSCRKATAARVVMALREHGAPHGLANGARAPAAGR
jgi:hypothetical protein